MEKSPLSSALMIRCWSCASGISALCKKLLSSPLELVPRSPTTSSRICMMMVNSSAPTCTSLRGRRGWCFSVCLEHSHLPAAVATLLNLSLLIRPISVQYFMEDQDAKIVFPFFTRKL